MATYLDTSNLSKDAQFLQRVTYAISKYAAYIEGEDAGATNHVARLNWALKANVNVQQAVNAVMPGVLADANVQYGLGNVTDSDLQTAVETAANQEINAAVSYADIIDLAGDPAFLRRIQVALMKFSNYIMGEDAGTTNHANRLYWAKATAQNTWSVAGSLSPAVAAADPIATALYASTDAQLQTAVETEVNAILLS